VSDQPSEGQLRGIGNRLDPQSILFAPEEINGLTWGYSIIDKNSKPEIFMGGEWKEFVPLGVWLQMLDAWEDLIKTIKQDPEKYEHYLQYPEIKERIEQD
jgi:hypothetical protein